MWAGGGQGGEGAAWLGAQGGRAGAGGTEGGLAVSVRPHRALWREGPAGGAAQPPQALPCPVASPSRQGSGAPMEGTILPGSESPAHPQSFPRWSEQERRPES